MTQCSQDSYFAKIAEQVDVDPKGLAIVLDTPEADILAWLALEKEPPRWFECYIDVLLALQKINRICYGQIGSAYE